MPVLPVAVAGGTLVGGTFARGAAVPGDGFCAARFSAWPLEASDVDGAGCCTAGCCTTGAGWSDPAIFAPSQIKACPTSLWKTKPAAASVKTSMATITQLIVTFSIHLVSVN